MKERKFDVVELGIHVAYGVTAAVISCAFTKFICKEEIAAVNNHRERKAAREAMKH